MQFLPMPHSVRETPGEFQAAWNTPVILSGRTAPGARLWAQMLREEIRSASGLDLRILRGEPLPGCILMDEDPSLPPEALIPSSEEMIRTPPPFTVIFFPSRPS